MKLAVSSYSFSQCLSRGDMTQLDCVAKAAQMGFDGIEFVGLAPNRNPTLEEQLAYAAQINAEAKRVGIEIVAYTVGASLWQGSEEVDAAEVERLCRQLDVAAALGARVFRHDACSKERANGKLVSFAQMLPTIAKNARTVSEYAKTLGIVTCTENHGFVLQDSDRVEQLYNAVGFDNYGLLVDMGNFACVDESSAKAVSRLAPYAVHVHAKDFRIRPFGTPSIEGERYIVTRGCNKLCPCAVGEGDIPVEQCLAILKKAGYDGYVSIEFEGTEDCLAAIARGKQYLEGLFAQ